MSIEAILVPHKDDLVCFFSFNLSPGSVFYARPPPLYVHTCDFLTKKPFLNTCISVLTVHYQNPSFGHESNNNFKDGLLLRYESLSTQITFSALQIKFLLEVSFSLEPRELQHYCLSSNSSVINTDVLIYHSAISVAAVSMHVYRGIV